MALLKGCGDLSNLDNLIDKIKQNGDDKAAIIIKNAEEQAAAIIEAKTGEAQKEKNDILFNAAIEAERVKERMLSDKTLEMRDKVISAKREAIGKVFSEAVNRLNNMPEAEFKAYVVGRLAGQNTDAEIILPQKYMHLLDDINRELTAKGFKTALKTQEGARAIDGGFILASGGVMRNETFDALADYYRDELEAEIIKNLF